VSHSIFKNNDSGAGYGDTYLNDIFCSNTLGIGIPFTLIQGCIIANNHIGIDVTPAVNILDNSIVNNDTGICSDPEVPVTYGTISNNIIFNKVINLAYASASNSSFPNNCWGTNDSLVIMSMIYDGYDNIALGLVNVSPFVNCDASSVPTDIDCNVILTGIEAHAGAAANELRVFPNPVTQESWIEFDNPNFDKYELIIHNMLGQCLLKLNEISGNRICIQHASLPHGIYNFQLLTGGKIKGSGEFIVE
jgi:hypothetical protein